MRPDRPLRVTPRLLAPGFCKCNGYDIEFDNPAQRGDIIHSLKHKFIARVKRYKY